MAELIASYLQDHHAGATAGVELARRAAASNEGNAYGSELRGIAEEIAADFDTLEQVMERLGVKHDPIKDRAAWIGERLGRLKRNGTWLSYSPLSRVVELEGLVVGVTGKLALWDSLRTLGGEALTEFELRRLGERARDQRERLEALRLRAVADALA